jgi:DNA primase
VSVRDLSTSHPQRRAVMRYLASRSLTIDDYEFYISGDKKFKKRLILPYYYNNKIVGWTARALDNQKPKYLADSDPGYVFNMDEQTHDRKFVIVVEGEFDALSIGGVSPLGSDLSPQQIMLLKSLNRDIIIVPDRDSAGKNLVNKALENNWAVSMPDWKPGIKDVNDAVNHYGKLYALYAIVTSAESSPVKIKLKAKKWFGGYDYD